MNDHKVPPDSLEKLRNKKHKHPWDLADLSQYLHYCCPECEFKSRQDFLLRHHMKQNHVEVNTKRKKLSAEALIEKFLKEEPPKDEGETMEEYMARRKENVGSKMRNYFDSYFTFDKNYSSMTNEQKDAEVARYNVNQGGLMRPYQDRLGGLGKAFKNAFKRCFKGILKVF